MTARPAALSLIRLALRRLADRPGRLIMTFVAIASSVAFASAALIVSDSLTDTFASIAVNANREVDLQVRSADDDLGARATLDQAVLDQALTDRLRGLDGVDVAIAGVEAEDSTVLALDASGEPVVPIGPPVKSFSWDGTASESLWLVDGVAPSGPEDVVFNVDYAEMVGVDIGDRVDFVTASGPDSFTLVGLVDLDVTAGAQFVLFDLETAQSVYGRGDTVDVIDLTLDREASAQGVADAVGELVPAGVEIVDNDQVVEDFREPFDTVIAVVRSALLGFAGIAVLVCLILIGNTFAVMVNQQTAELGALRAIGATRTQITAGVAAEAVIVGVIGSALGLAGGVGLAELMKLSFGAVGGFPETGTIVTGQTVLVAFVVGIGASFVGAILPAVAAGRVSPISAMRAVGTCPRPRGLTGRLFHALAPPSVDTAAPRSVARRLAISHAAADPRRTRATAAALTIGMAMIVVVGTIGQALRSEAAGAAERGLVADVIVSAQNITALESFAEGDLPEAGHVFELSGRLEGGEDVSVSALDSVAFDSVALGSAADNYGVSIERGGVGIDTDWAAERGIALGDELLVDLGAGLAPFTVTAIFERPGELVESIVVHVDTIDTAPRLVSLMFDLDDPATSMAVLEAAAARYPGIDVQDRAAYAAASNAQIDQIEMLANGLLAITVLIALIGVANTMALAISERRQEIAMLRSIGMTRRQVRRWIRWEAAAVSGYGIVVGVLVGLALAAAASGVLDGISLADLRPPPATVAAAAIIALIGSMIAAALPAHRAAVASR